jgi:hypothetical protein
MRNVCANYTLSDERNAYFEAGHAVVACLEGLHVVSVSINCEADACAWIDVREPAQSRPGNSASSDHRPAVLSVIRGLLAGPAAQKRFSFGQTSPELDLADERMVMDHAIWRAIDLAGQLPGNGSAILPALWREVAASLAKPKIWSAIEAVAQALLRERELAGCEVAEIVEYTWRAR